MLARLFIHAVGSIGNKATRQLADRNIMTDSRPTNKHKLMDKLDVEAEIDFPLFQTPAPATAVFANG